MAVASAGPYASLHHAPDRQPCQHLTTQFFTGWMPFLPPNQQRQSTEGMDNVNTHTHTFNGPFSETTRVSQYQKGKTNLDFTEARDSEWQWHQLGHKQVCTSLQTDNHARLASTHDSTPTLHLAQLPAWAGVCSLHLSSWPIMRLSTRLPIKG